MHQKQAHSVFLAVVVLGLLLAVSVQAYPSWRRELFPINDSQSYRLYWPWHALKGNISSKMSAEFYVYMDQSKIGRKKRSPADVSQLLDNHSEYESRSDDDRDSVESQEKVYDDIWRFSPPEQQQQNTLTRILVVSQNLLRVPYQQQQPKF